MSTKADNILNPLSCWNRAASDEPVFVLRAHDPHASTLVTMWANLYRESKGGWSQMDAAQRQKFNDALEVARQMREFYENDIPF